MSSLLPRLVDRYGQDRVVDVFEGTRLAEPAKHYGFGGYVVRAVLPTQQVSQWHDEIDRFMHLQCRAQSVMQCTSGLCTCRYNYEGSRDTFQNPLFKIECTSPFKQATEWLHQYHKVPRQEHFNQCVANAYARQADQAIPWHSDQTDLSLLGETGDIVSLTLGAACTLCWAPNEGGPLRRPGRVKSDRDDSARKAGYVGCTPLLPGDLFLATGRFQELLVHQTLPFSAAANVDEVLKMYPAVCEEGIDVFRSVYLKYFDKKRGKDRSVITWRRIENHVLGCPELMQRRPADHCGSGPARHRGAPEAAPPPGPPRPPPGPPPPELLQKRVQAMAPLLLKEELALFPDSEGTGPMLGPVPEAPMVVPDEALSPDQVQQDAFVSQVASAEVFLQWCRLAIDNFELYMQGSSHEVQVRIRETLRELAFKVRHGEKVQAMAEVSLEAAGSLCIFVVIMF